MTATATKTQADQRYNVVCMECGQVFSPAPRTPLWWKAHKRAERFLDAHHCTGVECGCVQARHKPDAPFRVFGYTDMCEDFDIPCQTFMEAARKYREMKRWCIVFIEGISYKTRLKLDWL